MKLISVEDILTFHQKIIQRTGGSSGIRDIGMVESALNRANATFDGKDLYQNVLDKISVITSSLIKNHGFVDGNKRIGVATMLLLLKLNNIMIEYQQKEIVELGLGVASNKLQEQQIKKWIDEHILNKA